MYHPRFLHQFRSLFAGPPLVATLHTHPLDQAGLAFAAGRGSHSSVRYLTVMAHAYANDHIALISARRLLDEAGITDHLHVVNRQEHLLAPQAGAVTGSIVSWSTVNSSETGNTGWVTAVFQRGDVVWEISAIGLDCQQLASFVLDLAADLVARQMDDQGLWALLPSVNDLPPGMRLDAVFGSTGLDEESIAA